jgi:hypothetical protein
MSTSLSSIRCFATATDTAGGADAASKKRGTPKPAVDPFTSTLPLTKLVKLPTLNGDFTVTKHTHTKLRLRDRRYLEWAAHRFDENGQRKWSVKTQARRNR